MAATEDFDDPFERNYQEELEDESEERVFPRGLARGPGEEDDGMAAEEDEEPQEDEELLPGGSLKGKGRFHAAAPVAQLGSSYSSTTSSFVIKSPPNYAQNIIPQPIKENVTINKMQSERSTQSDDDAGYVPQYHDPIEDALQKCFDQVTRPVSLFLCFLGWRPFPFFAHHHHLCFWILDYLYVLLVFFLLSCSFLFGLYYSVEVERDELISEYVMEAVVSFFLGIYGMWYFRREEGRAFEELSALIETVFLYTSNVTDKRIQDQLTYSLTNCLIAAGYFLLFYMGYSLWVSLTLAAQLVHEVHVPIPLFAFGVLVISFGKVIEHAFYVATIVIYWIICRLHMQYLDEIRDRLMKRTISLSRATRDIASIKKLIGDTNQGWGVAASFLAFSLAVQAIFIQVKFFEGEQFRFEYLQAGIGFSLSVSLFFTNLFPASLVCWSAERLKGMSWKLRAEQHYRKSTPDQVDSFLLFCSNTKMSAKIMGYPIWKEYLFFLAGLISILVFFLWRIGLYST